MSQSRNILQPAPDQTIPPPEMNFVGAGDFQDVGESLLARLQKFGLKPHHRVLDVGCGQGRVAIPMTRFLDAKGSYEGFDIREDGIQWCSEKITPLFPKFRFQLVKLRNSHYAPEEKGDPAEFEFPFPARSFDFVILTSVFTHLGDAVVCRYLDEIQRVLKRKGRMVATFFLFGRKTRARADRLAGNLSFPHHFGHYRLQSPENPDAAIAYQETWVAAQCERRGLQIHWPIRRGFQDIIVAEKKPTLPDYPPSSTVVERSPVRAPVSATSAIEIFWPESGTYHGRAVAGRHYPAQRWTRITLDIPPQDRGAVLRLDPCSGTGIVEIACIRITAKGRRKEGLKIRGKDGASGLKLEELVVLPSSRGLGFVSLGVDPKIFLPPISDDLFGMRLRVQILLRHDPSDQATLVKLRSLMEQFEHLRATEDRMAWLEEQWKAQSKRCMELEQMAPALKKAQEEFAGQAAAAGFLRTELAHTRKELDWGRNEIERLRRDNERRKIAVRAAERTFQFRWSLPSFLTNRRKNGAAPETSGFEFQIETPKTWSLPGRSVSISGWCFSKSGDCIQAIRARIGDRTFDGHYGRKRFDVQSVFPSYNNSGFCGFMIEVADLPARFDLVLEVLDDGDRWHTLTSISGKVTHTLFGINGGVHSKKEGLALCHQIMDLAASDGKRLKKEIAKMTERPRVSILMPVYNTPADYLREAIQSVMAQIYSDWQLCIADDASTSEATRTVLEEAGAKDARIKIEWRNENGGIASASNSALHLADGDIIALMDHDDLIAPVATLRLAQAVLSHAADLMYSDEAHINPAGEFMGGTYRPAFSPSYLQNHPYIVHLVAFSARLMREIGGFTEGLRISQDYDLILRAAEKAKSVVHIPEVLYLWRQLPTSAGHVHQESVMKVSSSILENHLQRTNRPGTVGQGFAFNFFKTDPKLHLPDLSVAIIIPTKNGAALLRRCVESLEKTLPPDLPTRIVIVDHDSTEEDALELLAELRCRHTVLGYSGSFNYSAINNFAVRRGAGEAGYLLFCNNDIEAVEPGWMEALLDAAADPSVGAVAPLLLYPDNETVQHAGVSVGLCGIAEHLGKFLPIRSPDGSLQPGYQGLLRVTREVAAITTGFALVRRGAFEAVGGFNEEMQVGFNDTDLCLRLWQSGHRVLYCGETFLIHHESATRGKSFDHDPHPADSRRFRETWGWLLEKGDPFYNPNLRADSTSWESNPLAKREAKPRFRHYQGPASLFKK